MREMTTNQLHAQHMQLGQRRNLSRGLLVYGIAFILLGVLVGAVLLFMDQRWVQGEWALFGAVLALTIAYLAPVTNRIAKGQFDPFEPPIAFGAFFWVALGLTSLAFLIDGTIPLPGARALGWSSLSKALLILLVAWLVFYAAYSSRFAEMIDGKVKRSQTTKAWEPKPTLAMVGVVLGGVGLITRVVLIQAGLYGAIKAQNFDLFRASLAWFQVVSYVAWAGTYAIVILLIAWLVQRSRLALMGLVVLVPAEILLAVISGYRTPVLQVFFYLAATVFYCKRRVVWKTLVVGMLILFLSDPLLRAYRPVLYENAARSPLSIIGESTAELFGSQDPLSIVAAGGTALRERVTYLPNMAAAISYRDTRGELEDPATFLALPFLQLIPRFVWPSKPEDNTARDFNVIVLGSNPLTANSPFLPGWLYLELPLVGLLLYMGLYGLILRAAYAYFRLPSDLGHVLFAAMLTWTLAIDAVWGTPFSWLQALVYQSLILLLVRRVTFNQVSYATAGEGNVESSASP